MTLLRDSDLLVRTPVYHQLNDRLLALIRDGSHAPGSRFLTEREVAARFGVSRLTANKSLSGLVSAGHLEFRKGVGTFVRAHALENDLRSLVSFTHHARQSGHPPETRVLQLRRLTAAQLSADQRQALAIETTAPLLFVERLRLAAGQPVILERRHLVADRCPGLDRRALAGSLYEWFARQGIPLTRSDQRIRSVSLDARDARLLSTRPRSAALWVHAVGHGRQPLWVEDTLYRGDRYEFHNLLAEGTPPRPARGSLFNPAQTNTRP